MSDERNVVLEVTCNLCGKKHELLVRHKDLVSYVSPNRGYIQDIFPYLNAGERELLISGVCPSCWNDMFGGDEDEE